MTGEEPRLGFIGEVKKCKINALPKVGEQVHTYLEVVSEVASVTLMKAKSLVNDAVIAECQMKIFMQND